MTRACGTGAECRRCGRGPLVAATTPGMVRVGGRGLCAACYAWAHYHGKLADYPRATRRAEDVVEDVAILRGRGLSLAEIAAQLGMAPKSVGKACCRYRRRRQEAA